MTPPAWPAPWQSSDTVRAPRRGRIDVWRLAVPAVAEEVGPLLGLLSEAERQRTQRKRIDAKRFEYIAGQAILRRFLSHALDVAPETIRYRRGHKGKPYLCDGGEDGIEFNISHSAGQVLLALGMGIELGIDLERVNPRTGCERVARRAFSARERAQMNDERSAAGRLRFFQMWTCKEAVVKCSGDGIHSGMARFSIDLSADGRHARISETEGNQHKVRDYRVLPLPVPTDFAAALVHTGPAMEVALWQLDTPALIRTPE